MSVQRRRRPLPPPRPVLADWALQLSPAQIARVTKRAGRQLLLERLAIVACFLAGIWWDTRFLATALVPVALLAVTRPRVAALEWRRGRRAERAKDDDEP